MSPLPARDRHLRAVAATAAGWVRAHPRLVDAVLATGHFALFGLYQVIGVLDPPRVPDWRARGSVVLAITVAHATGVLWRRHQPVLAFWIVVAGCLLQLATTDEMIPTDLAVPVAAYGLARWSRSELSRRIGLIPIALAGPLAALDWGVNPKTVFSLVASSVFLSAFPVLSWVWGDLNRKRADLLDRLSAQNAALLRDHAQREQLAAAGERARIAREMHDVVAHSLSVIVVQADGAAYAAEHAPAWNRSQAADTLGTVARTARQALAETRHLVGVLRQAGDDAEYVPAQGLSEIDALLESVRAAGLDVDAQTDIAKPVPREVDLAAYRIAQEALTNALRHAGSDARVRVRLDRTPEALVIDIQDDGRGAPIIGRLEGSGSGLIGMRERASAVGGTISTGPRRGGGWAVHAELPIEAQDD